MWQGKGKELDTSVVRLQTLIIEAKTDLIYHFHDEFPSDKPDKQRRKKRTILMKRGDAYFTSIGNIFCCSERFLPSDFKLSTLIETGSRTLGFPLHKS